MEAWLDTQFCPYGTEAQPLTSMFFGPNFLAKRLYQLSPPQVLLLFITQFSLFLKLFICVLAIIHITRAMSELLIITEGCSSGPHSAAPQFTVHGRLIQGK